MNRTQWNVLAVSALTMIGGCMCRRTPRALQTASTPASSPSGEPIDAVATDRQADDVAAGKDVIPEAASEVFTGCAGWKRFARYVRTGERPPMAHSWDTSGDGGNVVTGGLIAGHLDETEVCRWSDVTVTSPTPLPHRARGWAIRCSLPRRKGDGAILKRYRQLAGRINECIAPEYVSSVDALNPSYISPGFDETDLVRVGGSGLHASSSTSSDFDVSWTLGATGADAEKSDLGLDTLAFRNGAEEWPPGSGTWVDPAVVDKERRALALSHAADATPDAVDTGDGG